jgi:outer membrane lipoprotein SlyB
MRPPALLLTIATAALSLSLAGCAGTTSGDTYLSRSDKLAGDCRARGGVLTSTGAQTGRPETDNACTINGGATRLPPANP